MRGGRIVVREILDYCILNSYVPSNRDVARAMLDAALRKSAEFRKVGRGEWELD
jgi:hypothetical protein